MPDLNGKVGFMGEFPDFQARGFDIDAYNRRFRTSNLIINATTSDVSYPKHWGPLSIKCASRGREFYQAGNATFAVDDDCFLVLDQDREYSSWIPPGNGVNSFTVNIAPAFQREAIHGILLPPELMMEDTISRTDHRITFTEQLYQHNDTISPVLWLMRRLSKDDAKGNNVRLQELFVTLMEQLVHLQLDTSRKMTDVDKIKRSTRHELYKRLCRARDFLYSVYDQPVDLGQVAAVACLNQHYFLRQFRKYYGITPHQFLTRRRMDIASRMLRRNDMPVEEVCQAVGYSDVSSFAKLFKRYAGVSPSHYRSNQTMV
jgi:AraC-like DNA-binding protein